jgi:hypothetical protein
LPASAAHWRNETVYLLNDIFNNYWHTIRSELLKDLRKRTLPWVNHFDVRDAAFVICLFSLKNIFGNLEE